MASILRLLCEIAFVTELLRQDGSALTSHVEDNLLQWEYEDFVLERYKQRLLGSVKRVCFYCFSINKKINYL